MVLYRLQKLMYDTPAGWVDLDKCDRTITEFKYASLKFHTFIGLKFCIQYGQIVWTGKFKWFVYIFFSQCTHHEGELSSCSGIKRNRKGKVEFEVTEKKISMRHFCRNLKLRTINFNFVFVQLTPQVICMRVKFVKYHIVPS